MSHKLFEKNIGVTFQNKSILEVALIHRSYVNEHKEIKEHNERLEFLGDAVLELITTEYLYKNFSDDEGELTNLRSSIVKRETLSQVGRDIEVGKYLLLSKGEKASKGNEKEYILANTVEAVIGAIYLDQGYEIAKKFVEKYIISKLEDILKTQSHIDSKSLFQEKAQEIEGITPEYKEIFAEGPDHNRIFTMGVYLGNDFVAQGKGSNKQVAEQNAAKQALIYKGWNIE